MHSLRHSWASALATGGLAATTLARVTGHSDPGFTYCVYAREARDDAALVADVLDRAANVATERGARASRRDKCEKR
jgi:integrase